jgi:hypothetical protein
MNVMIMERGRRLIAYILVTLLLLVLSYYELGIDASRGLYLLTSAVFVGIMTTAGYMHRRFDDFSRRESHSPDDKHSICRKRFLALILYWVLSLLNFGLLTLGATDLTCGDAKKAIFVVFLSLIIEIALSLWMLDYWFDRAIEGR